MSNFYRQYYIRHFLSLKGGYVTFDQFLENISNIVAPSDNENPLCILAEETSGDSNGGPLRLVPNERPKDSSNNIDELLAGI